VGAPKLETQNIIKKLDELPSLPAVVYELSRVINDPMSSTKEVEAIMSQDIGLTTKVLKLANSAYYAIPGGVSSLARAIGFIGFDTIHQLVLSASIIKALEVKGPSTFDINEFWKHSIGVAIASEVIAKHVRHPNPSDVFTAGLVHDMGKLALYLVSNEVLLYIIENAEKNKKTFLEIETENNYTNHAELGLMLGEKWRLPKTIQVAARYHHEKDIARRGGLSSDFNQVVDIVMLANLLVHALKFGNAGHMQVLGAPNDLLERLMINPKTDMPLVLKNIKSSLESASEFIKLIGAT
jgi:putative nucleotidyltransferase with HDIG domain